MSIAIPSRPRAGRRRPSPAIFATLALSGVLLSGCGERMALKVNGVTVSQEQFYQECVNSEVSGLLSPPVGYGVINQLIAQQLMTQEARRLKLLPSEGEVDTQVNTIRKQLSANGTSLDQRLKQIGLPMEAVREAIRIGLTQRKLMTQGVTVTDKEIENYYNQNKMSPQFTTPEQVDAEQITVAGQAAANEVKQTLDKNADFRLVAHTKSIDQYKDQGGVLPTLQRGYPLPPGLNAAVAAEAFKLPAGQVSSPLKVGNQWVILKVVSKKPQIVKTLAEVKDEIRQQLLQTKAQQGGQAAKFAQRMGELQRDADIQVGIEQFKQPIMDMQKSLKQQPPPGMTPALPGAR